MAEKFEPSGQEPNQRLLINNINGITDSKEIVEFLNGHFCETGTRVQNSIQGKSKLEDFAYCYEPPQFEFCEISMADTAAAMDRPNI